MSAVFPCLSGAVVRDWCYDGDTLRWSLLVPSDDGHVAVDVTYSGAFLVRTDGLVLDDVPLEHGRAYRVHEHVREEAPVGGFDRMAFWPTPQFRVGFAQVHWRQRERWVA